MKIIRQIFIVLIILGLTACKIDSNAIMQQEDHLSLSRHFYNPSKPAIETEITKESAKYRELLKWFEKNQNDWTPSVVTYAPNVMVTGQKFNINFTKGGAILNFEVRKGKWRQYVRDVKEEEYQFLVE